VVIDGVRPDWGASVRRPSILCARNYVTLRGETFSVAAICLFLSPSAAGNMKRLHPPLLDYGQSRHSIDRAVDLTMPAARIRALQLPIIINHR
jgi:hypothetical protein